jgi:WD40 repeat protein
VVRATFSPDGNYFATASYDHTIVIYQVDPSTSYLSPPEHEDDIPLDGTDDPLLACDPSLRYQEVKRIKVESNPEAIVWHPQSTWLLYTLRSSHLLYYVSMNGWQTRTKSFNPHPRDNHVSFSVLNLAIHPSGRILACQTGDQRGGAGERILLYGIEPDEVGSSDWISWLTGTRLIGWLACGQAQRAMISCYLACPGCPMAVA